MAKKNIETLFSELCVLKRDMDDSLLVHHRLFTDDNHKTTNEEVKLHLMKLTSISKAITSLQSSVNHYLAMAEIRLAVARAHTTLSESFKRGNIK